MLMMMNDDDYLLDSLLTYGFKSIPPHRLPLADVDNVLVDEVLVEVVVVVLPVL